MRKYLLLLALPLFLLMAACSPGVPAAENTAQRGDGPVVTVYRAPT